MTPPGAGSSQPHSFARLGGQILFGAYQSTTGNELWTTDGTAASPITIKGSETGKDASGRFKTVLSGTSGGNVISINNSYYTLDGFTINGQPGIDRTEYPTTLDQVRAFKDSVQSRAVNSKLVYVGAANGVFASLPLR